MAGQGRLIAYRETLGLDPLWALLSLLLPHPGTLPLIYNTSLAQEGQPCVCFPFEDPSTHRGYPPRQGPEVGLDDRSLMVKGLSSRKKQPPSFVMKGWHSGPLCPIAECRRLHCLWGSPPSCPRQVLSAGSRARLLGSGGSWKKNKGTRSRPRPSAKTLFPVPSSHSSSQAPFAWLNHHVLFPSKSFFPSKTFFPVAVPHSFLETPSFLPQPVHPSDIREA